MTDEALLDQVRQVFRAEMETLVARLEAVDDRRAAGDRELAQSQEHLRDDMRRNTSDLGKLQAHIERVEKDLSRSIRSIRQEFDESLQHALLKVRTDVKLDVDDADEKRVGIDARVEKLEDRLLFVAGLAAGGLLTDVAPWVIQAAQAITP